MSENIKNKEISLIVIDNSIEILRLKDIQDMFCLSKTGAYKLVKRQKFSTLMCGNKMFINAEEVFEFYNNKITREASL